jgi:hypothetical protein
MQTEFVSSETWMYIIPHTHTHTHTHGNTGQPSVAFSKVIHSSVCSILLQAATVTRAQTPNINNKHTLAEVGSISNPQPFSQLISHFSSKSLVSFIRAVRWMEQKISHSLYFTAMDISKSMEPTQNKVTMPKPISSDYGKWQWVTMWLQRTRQVTSKWELIRYCNKSVYPSTSFTQCSNAQAPYGASKDNDK